jgi:cation diffusion facilitator family transporter
MILSMQECCEIRAVPQRQRRVLVVVLCINAAMFVGELAAGLLADSTALLADSVDMLGDAIVYGFSLYVVARGRRWQARAARLKGGIMVMFGIGVLTEAIMKILRGVTPAAEVMTGVSVIALAANAICLRLLWHHKDDDVNMGSAWLCSRNDVVANVGVLMAGMAVAVTGWAWPDIVVGLVIACLFSSSGVKLLRGL